MEAVGVKSSSSNDAFMDLSEIGCSLLLDQQLSVNVTMCDNNSYLSPPPYPNPSSGGLTPYQSPYVSPYVTPLQTPSHSPSSPSGMNNKEPLAVIPECGGDPFASWNNKDNIPPPPYPDHRVVTGRPPPSGVIQPYYRTQLKQQLQRQQLEQQERRERELAKQQQADNSALSVRASSCPVDHHHQMGIPGVISRIDPSSSNTSLAVATATVPPQVLKVRTRLENPTLYHVVESRKRQVRQFLQHNLPESAGINSAPPGGFILNDSPIVQETQPSSSRADVNCEAETT